MDFNKLVNNYSKLVYKICFDLLKNTEDAKDATQDTYIKIYKSIYKYTNLDDNSIKNIICRIAVNTCKDYFKSKQFKIISDSIDENVIDNTCYDSIYINEIIDAINNLNITYRDVIYEYLVNNESLDYISEKYNIDKDSLKVKINRGKNILKSKIKRSSYG